MDCRLLTEHGLEVGVGERRGVQRPEPLTDHQRPGECLLHGDLLVEREAHEQRHRI